MKYLLSEIAEICGGELRGRDREATSLSTDSRSCTFDAGSLFVAMRGANHDSHLYAAQMAARGVKAFLTERAVELPADCGQVTVGNAIEALQRLAAHYRAGFRGEVVAVTGSNGKTVVKEWIAQAVPAGVKFFRSPKSYNSQLGVPLSLLMAAGDEELVVIETGISRPGEMARRTAATSARPSRSAPRRPCWHPGPGGSSITAATNCRRGCWPSVTPTGS